jgi:hypothetical protein
MKVPRRSSEPKPCLPLQRLGAWSVRHVVPRCNHTRNSAQVVELPSPHHPERPPQPSSVLVAEQRYLQAPPSVEAVARSRARTFILRMKRTGCNLSAEYRSSGTHPPEVTMNDSSSLVACGFVCAHQLTHTHKLRLNDDASTSVARGK